MTVDPLISLAAALLCLALCGLILWPGSGLLWRWRQTRQATERVLIEDALKHIHDAQAANHPATLESVAGALRIAVGRSGQILGTMLERGLLRQQDGCYELTEDGRDYAVQIIRAHRLWECYLADTTGYADQEWHGMAHREEHRLSPAQVEELASRLNHPSHDPHGDPIPTAAGALPEDESAPLTQFSLNKAGRIVHLEDEPAAVYAQLVAEGLHPGQELRVIESTPQRLVFRAAGGEHVLAPVVAANIAVVPVQETARTAPQQEAVAPRLSGLRLGQQARIAGLAPTCRGSERRRFLDLGILPGTEVEAAVSSPSGNPVAYRVRGALVALRRDQADSILVEPETPESN